MKFTTIFKISNTRQMLIFPSLPMICRNCGNSQVHHFCWISKRTESELFRNGEFCMNYYCGW